MTDPRNAKIHELFDQAVERSADQRVQFLDEACRQDVELRTAVQSLLTAHDRAAQFLADPTIPAERLFPPDFLFPGSHVGPYILLRMIGEGGYGSVYEAQQEQPLRRTVAVKVVKPGMDTRQVIARFELERQALAMMDHSNIARVLDAGATDAGRPFFVMELVDGQPLTDYCRSNALDVVDRLELFRVVCDAVQHAHQKGIIHRDLKPGNVLVALRDGRPIPKVIDFGIAKVLHGPAAGSGPVTEQPQFLGTPQYMSPEQAQSPPVDLDTRSDIYSLGVLLYELLTDAAPFDPASLRSAADEQVRRIIREVDPPPPSTRLMTPSQTPSTERSAFRAEARKRAQQVRGDLDWIAMKAMDKDRSRRYGTAEALSDDIGRYLSNEPVLAGPPGRIYRVRKFARRNRRLLATAAVVIAALGIGLAAALAGLVRARHSQAAEARQRQRAEEQRLAAEANQHRAEDQAQRLLGAQRAFFHLLIPQPDGTATPRDVLDFIVKRAGDGLLTPEAEAPVRTALGEGYFRLKLWDDALRQFRRGLDLQRELTGPDTPDVAAFLSYIGACLMYDGQYDQAEQAMRRPLAVYHARGFRVVAPGEVRRDLAAVLSAKGDLAGAESVLRDALASMQNTPYIAQYDPLGIIRRLAQVREDAGDGPTAEKLRQAAQILHRRLASELVPTTQPQ